MPGSRVRVPPFPPTLSSTSAPPPGRTIEPSLVSRRRAPARRLPAGVAHHRLRTSLAAAHLFREHYFLVLSATALDHILGDPVQDHVALDSVLHVSARDDEDGSLELRNSNLPTPSKATDLVLPCSGVDFEQCHPCEMPCQLREQQPLLLHRKRIRRAFVGMALHLYQGCGIQPGSIRLVSPKPRAQVQDSPHDRQVAIDRPRTLASLQPVSNE